MPVYFIHSIPAWRRCRREATDEVCPSIAATGRLPSTYLFAMRTGEGEGTPRSSHKAGQGWGSKVGCLHYTR